MILPLKQDVVKTYPYGTLALATTLSHEEAWPWFYNSYVNLYFDPSTQLVRGNFVDADIRNGECPFIHPIQIPREILDKKWERFSDFVEDAIGLGYYITLYLNRYYLSDTPEYHMQHFPHRCFLYGCENGNIYGADFFHKSYCTQRFLLSEIDDAYRSYRRTTVQFPLTVPDVTIFKVDFSDPWEFDPSLFLSYLKDYYNRTETTGIFLRHPARDMAKNFVYGMEYYDCMLRMNAENTFDMRTVQILYEHKHLMRQRLPFVFDFFQTGDDALAKGFQELEKKSLLLRNIALRYELRGDGDTELSKIMECRLTELRNEESALWPELISLLEKRKGMIF